MRNQSGETIAETLVAVLISAVCFVGLQTSIVAAARINKQAENQIKSFQIAGSSSAGTNSKVEIVRGTEREDVSNIGVKYSKDGNYYYYESN